MNKTSMAILIMLCLTAALMAKPEMIRIYGGWMNVGEDEDEKPSMSGSATLNWPSMN